MTAKTIKPPLERPQRAGLAVAALTRDSKKPTGEPVPAILKQPGPRADLKRCQGQPDTNPAWNRAWQHLIAYLPERDPTAGPWRERDVREEQRSFISVAAMICAQKPKARDQDLETVVGATSPRNLGASLAIGVGERNLSNREVGLHRLILFSRQNVDGIHHLLPKTVQYLRGALVPIDWAKLIGDLADWRRHRRDITKWWIQDYHRTLHRIETDKTREDNTTVESETT